MDIRVIEFKTEYRNGKPDVDWVLFTSSDALGDSGQLSHGTWEKVSRLVPPEAIRNDDGGLKMAAMRSQWNQIEPAYRAWKEGSALPERGTPLGAWPGVNQDQAEVLRRVGLATVEAVAEAPEAVLAKPPLPNMREIKQQASIWLEGQDRAAQAAVIAELQERNAAAMQMIEDLQKDKPKRGRPPKSDQNEAA